MLAIRARSCRKMAMPSGTDHIRQRVLILAPVGRDAQAAAQHLAESKIECVICRDTEDLDQKLRENAGVGIVTEEALVRGNTQAIEIWVASQPPWSDFPFIVLTSRTTSNSAHQYRMRLLNRLGNVSMLERPLNTVSLMSTVRSALRARRRQYEVQDHLLEREHFAAHLEDLVHERTQQLEEANQQLRQSESK
jgi:DNA-binding NtrC family response regulator